MIRPIHTAILSTALLILVLAVPDPGQAQQSYTITLTGEKSVPPVGTGAMGKLTVTFRSDTLIVSGSFESLRGQYHSGGIFVGRKDERGNRLYLLTVDLNKEKTGGKYVAEKNRFHLNEPQKKLLAAGQFYISIVSYEHTHGEIRAQIPGMSGKTP